MKIFKRALSAATASIMAASVCIINIGDISNIGTADAADLTAVQLVEAMGQGWNLGNSFDSTNTWTTPLTPEAIETAWGNPVTTEAMIKEIKKSGFNTVRIPITWQQMIDSNGKPDEAWLARIKEVVDYCIDNGMYAIINTHHDEGGSNQSGWINGTGVSTKFANLWTNIANYFKDYDQHLVFEGMNEEDLSNSVMMSLNQTFVDAVRATGGNNAKRLLLVEAQSNNTAKALDSSFSAPTDSANMIAVSVHYYEPSTFCVATTSSTWGHRETWGTANDYTTLESDLDKLETKFIKNGIPVIIGEYGVDTSTKGAKDKASMKAFLKEVATYSLGKDGMCPVLWDMSVDNNGTGDMAYFDRTTLSWYDDEIKQIFIDAANGGSTDIGKTKVDRLTFKAADVMQDDGTLLIDLKPYKELGITVNNVVVNYSISYDGTDASTYGAGGAVSYNMVDGNDDIHWACSNYGFVKDGTDTSVEIPSTITASDDEGNEYTGTLDMDYLKVENWYTWTDPSTAKGTVSYEYGDIVVIFSDYFYVDGIADSETTTTTKAATTTTTTAKATTTTTVAEGKTTTTEAAKTTTTSAGGEETTTTTSGEEEPDFEGVYGNAYLAGSIGTNDQIWNAADAANTGKVAAVDGNGTFEAQWDVADPSASIDFLMLQIETTEEFGHPFTTDTFPDLSLTVDHVYVDGTEIELTDNAKAYDLRYYENGGFARAYLRANWGKKEDLGVPGETTVEQNVKVIFTVGGTYKDGTSNVTDTTGGVCGDANGDGEIKLNDAVLIMQAISNPNKFGIDGTDDLHITEKGWANADCNNPGDGVTGKDALAIQKYMLKLIETLPEK